MQNTVFSSAIRAFLIALFTLLGVSAGLLLILFAVSGLSSVDEDKLKIDTDFKPEIVANASGVRKELNSSAPIILKINIDGVIGAESITTSSITQQLQESREGVLKDGRVKAILIVFNTPGGTVTDSDGIYRAIKSYKEQYKVPVYGYIEGICASGGMYISSACDKLYSNPASIIGSVGVLMPSFFNVSKVLDKFGIESLTLSAGKGKDELNPFKPWQKGDEDNLEAIIKYYYARFVDILTTARPSLNKEKLIEDFGAKVFPAPTALENGYIDSDTSTEASVLKELAEKIGITDDYYQVVQMAKKSWWKELFKNNMLFTGEVKHTLNLLPEMHPKLSNEFLYLWRPS